ncbi:MAG: hydrolase [Clostridia bacterium]|nr:hydrolase [Clostridia bacterium]
MDAGLTREQAVALLRQYNKEPFHLQHALTVEGVMRWYARQLGYGEDEAFWGLAGLLHDIDFEMYPEAHCIKAPELLEPAGASAALIRAVCSHGYAITVDIKPEHDMEKALYAADELTGLIGAVVLMLPSRDIADLQLKSLKKKFKDKKFAAGCSREVIARGAELLGWELDKLFEDTIAAMQSCDHQVRAELAAWTEEA